MLLDKLLEAEAVHILLRRRRDSTPLGWKEEDEEGGEAWERKPGDSSFSL